MLIRFVDFLKVFKSVFLILGLFLTLAFGNYFRTDWIPIAWMFGFSALVGFVFRNKKDEGAMYFLAPAILLPGIGFVVNYQLYFALELLLIVGGYFIGNAGFEKKRNSFISVALLISLSLAVVGYLQNPMN